MSEEAGEKTEQASQKKLEEAFSQGQFPRSAEIQTAAILFAGLISLQLAGPQIWRRIVEVYLGILGHLHDIPISEIVLQDYAVRGLLTLALIVGPVVLSCAGAAVLVGLLQSRFTTASEALDIKWDKLNPAEGLQRMFSARAAMPAFLGVAKMSIIFGLSYKTIRGVVDDPIFVTSISVARIAEFMANTASQIGYRIASAVLVLAAIDYGYQFWQTSQDLMMTKQEQKDEMKGMEGNPQMKARMRRRRATKSLSQMLADVPKADVIVTNPTHLAVALLYDRESMKAPKIIAKGSRLNALRIREMAAKHQVPIMENKPLARMMFKYGRVDGEIPAELYSAVAEVLAWVYRVNRYRYFSRQNAATVLPPKTVDVLKEI